MAEGRLEGADLGLQLRHIRASPPPKAADVYRPASCFPSLPGSPSRGYIDIFIYIYIFFFLPFFLSGPLKQALPCNHAQLSSPGGFEVKRNASSLLMVCALLYSCKTGESRPERERDRPTEKKRKKKAAVRRADPPRRACASLHVRMSFTSACCVYGRCLASPVRETPGDG